MSREERIAAARAKAEAMKAQRAAVAPAQAAPGPSAPPAAGRPAAAAGVPGRATAANPGGAPPTAPQHPKVEAFGTITQSVEFRADPTEAQNLERLLGGLGLYRNPLRGAWQLDYRFFAEARRRLQAAGYQVEGRDYLGRPLEQWAPHTRGWTRLGSPD
ncbi:MAG TPA: hypothetical protein VEW91_09090 [bacterium]|nr:hypothetical protein [bacterium]